MESQRQSEVTYQVALDWVDSINKQLESLHTITGTSEELQTRLAQLQVSSTFGSINGRIKNFVDI